MSTQTRAGGAIPAPMQSIETNGRRLAFRSIGHGTPIVLCTRFRGNIDLWDPLFLDSLAAHVATFVRTTRRHAHA